MVRLKTQKAGGIVNWLRGLRRSRKVQPLTETTQRRINIKDESYSDALKRDYVFLSYKLKGREVPKEKRFVSPTEELEVKQTLLQADQEGLTEDEIIQQVFQADPSQFNEEFRAWEEYQPDRFLNKGTSYERRAFPLSKSLGRFIATIKASPKNMRYQSDFMVHLCEISTMDQPARTLSDDYCVTILTEANKESYLESRGEMFPLSYIVVKPEFVPKGTSSGGPIALSAKRLPTLSFLLDAFRQNGVLEIEPILKTTLQRETPELLSYGSTDPIVLVTPYYLRDQSVTQGRFIVMASTLFTRGRNVVNMKDVSKSKVLQDAFVKRSVYIMDPKTMYKIRDEFPQLWMANFGALNRRVYRTLPSEEKLSFCFLQYIKFLEYYSLLRDANSRNENAVVKVKTENAARRAMKRVFELNYEAGISPFDLLENFGREDTENWRLLIDLQKEVLGSAKITTPAQLRKLLAKFTQNKNQISETVAPATRKNRVRQMLTAPEIQTQRAELYGKFKSALAAPTTKSILPRFLRSRKAINANKKTWVTTVQRAQKDLVNFNESHGIRTPAKTNSLLNN